ncbi:MAG: fasciclin domain-containing protein [Chloroflexia bacterium]|nr:fasciclin domain-containing protein [Chloroflexia bacterium]
MLAVSIFACKTTSDDNLLQPLPVQLQGATQNAMEVLDSNPQFSALSAAIKQYGLEAELRRFPARFTIFAPNNQAFEAINLAGVPDSAVRNVLRYHIFQTESFRFASQISSGANETSAILPNNLVWINVPRLGEVFINGTPVLRADIPATNAVIHEIGVVLQPPTKTMYQIIAEEPTLSRFREAANSTNDLAFPTSTMVTSLRQRLKSTRFQGSIFDGASSSSIFEGQNSILFVPNNVAFDEVGLTDSLLVGNFINLPAGAGARVFNFHLSQASGRLFANGLTPGALPTLVPGRPLNLFFENGTIAINRKSIVDGVELQNDPIGLSSGFNNSNIITKDILATNGVIHIVDRVLLPEN